MTRVGAVLTSPDALDALPVGACARAGGLTWQLTRSHGWVTPTDLGNVMADVDQLLEWGPVTVTHIPKKAGAK